MTWWYAALAGTGGGQDLWTAVGASGKIATATDPTGTWTQRTSGTANTLNAAAAANGYLVAVGNSGTLVYASSSDPASWSSNLSSFSTTTINVVANGGGYWVAAGGSGKLATATTPGGTWTQRTSGFGSKSITALAYGNGVWVAGCQTGNLSGAIRTASDPTSSWTSRTWGAGSSSYPAIEGIIWDGAQFVAVDQDGYVCTSPTGATWTDRGYVVGGSPEEKVLAFGNAVYLIALSGSSGSAYSANATSWNSSNPGFRVYGAAGNTSILVVAGASGTLKTTTDGSTFTSRTSSFGTTQINGLAYGGA